MYNHSSGGYLTSNDSNEYNTSRNPCSNLLFAAAAATTILPDVNHYTIVVVVVDEFWIVQRTPQYNQIPSAASRGSLAKIKTLTVPLRVTRSIVVSRKKCFLEMIYAYFTFGYASDPLESFRGLSFLPTKLQSCKD